MTRTTRPSVAFAFDRRDRRGSVCWVLTGSRKRRSDSLTVTGGFSQGGPATTIDTVDIGVPGGQNVTGQSVRWERVSLVGVPPAVHLKTVFAYAPGPGVGLVTGNLIKDCPQDKAYPLTRAVVPPHAQMRWNVVIALTFAKPGRYNVRRVKIVYVTDGHRGWQYQDVSTTMVISSPRKGAKPQPTWCG